MASPSEDHFERVRFIQQEWNFCFSSKRRKYLKKKLIQTWFFFTDATLQCSTSSSLEIVDALTEAAEDTPDQHLQKVRMVDMSAQLLPNDAKNNFALCILYFTLSLSEGEQPCRVRALLPRPGDGRGEHLRRLPGCNDHLAVCPGWSSP